MYGPGTAVVAAGTAGFEAVTAPESVRSGQPRAVAAGVTPTVVPAARSAELPCTDDPELFFAESPQDVETAKALCVGCAARMACLSGAVERREPWGVWGGELFLRGQIVPRKRPRGRPRKHDVAA
jgi:WhiB family redox-sensing transcriptional regulator